MTRSQLEHIIRAASQIADDDELVIIGSQAVLGQFPRAPEALLVSAEADLYPRNKPELADLIDGSIGELSPFHEIFGYYAHGVAPTTAILPRGWQERLVPIRGESTRGATGWCLEIHDLVVSKLVAGRAKDLDFARTATQSGLVEHHLLAGRLGETSLDSDRSRGIVESRLRRISAEARAEPS